MGGRLSKLSDTRWQYETGKRVYFIRQVSPPNEDALTPGLYWVDGGADHTGTLAAHSIEGVIEALEAGQTFVQPTGSVPH